ncbi:MAG: flagellar biosynthesis protein FlgN [Treponema sp.]|jgi:uncharacterized small protein (DUF1192 family)|nr:flagellar biosynthesis protein FlgN [Treponema sp.]
MVKEKNLSEKEISQRVAVLKRFKELLKAQRERFAAYLDALDRSKDVIERGTTDDLIRHVELEEKIITDIHSIQKVIDPLEGLYRSMRLESSGAEGIMEPGGEDVTSLKSTLAQLGKEAAARSERNRNMLTIRMAELRSEIKNLRSNPFLQKRGARQSAAAPSLVDIRG